MTQAIADTLPLTQGLDSILGLEKGLIQTMGEEDGPTPLAFIIDSLKKDQELDLESR